MTVNKVILVGNLGADPETRTTQSGSVVTNLRIATTEREKDRDGNWGDHTEWHTVVLFGKAAENAARFLKKGRQVYVEGRLRTRKWQDKEGRDRWNTEVLSFDVKFLGGNREGGPRSEGGAYPEGGSGGYGGSGGGREAPPPPPDRGGGFEGGGGGGPDEDIPF